MRVHIPLVAMLLVFAGCDDKNNDDVDTSTDTAVDDDVTVDTPEDPIPDTVEDTSVEPIPDTIEDTMTDTVEDIVTDAMDEPDVMEDPMGDPDAEPDMVDDPMDEPDAESDAPGVMAFGDECTTDGDCASGVCWDINEYDPYCWGTGCSITCSSNAECITEATTAGAPTPSAATCTGLGECDLWSTGLVSIACA